MAAAGKAYARLIALDDSAAARVRISHLAFIQGKTAEAVKQSRAALAAAKAESTVGSGLAWYEYQLGDTLIGTGDRKGAAAAYAAAVTADPRFHLAHWGLGRVAAADGRLDDAIAEVSTAIAIVPLPEFLARRADLYRMRAAEWRCPARGRRPQDGPGDRPAGRRRTPTSTTGPWPSTWPDRATIRAVPSSSPRPRSRAGRTSTGTMPSPGHCWPTTARRRPTPR